MIYLHVHPQLPLPLAGDEGQVLQAQPELLADVPEPPLVLGHLFIPEVGCILAELPPLLNDEPGAIASHKLGGRTNP